MSGTALQNEEVGQSVDHIDRLELADRQASWLKSSSTLGIRFASIVGAFKSGWLSASWVGAPLKAAIDSAPQPSAVTWMQFKAANSSTGK